LAGIDLLTGKVHALVKDRHRSREFIEFLKLLNAAYPAGTAIKLILDNHSAHIITDCFVQRFSAQNHAARDSRKLGDPTSEMPETQFAPRFPWTGFCKLYAGAVAILVDEPS
jgi:hypothetical protein